MSFKENSQTYLHKGSKEDSVIGISKIHSESFDNLTLKNSNNIVKYLLEDKSNKVNNSF